MAGLGTISSFEGHFASLSCSICVWIFNFTIKGLQQKKTTLSANLRGIPLSKYTWYPQHLLTLNYRDLWGTLEALNLYFPFLMNSVIIFHSFHDFFSVSNQHLGESLEVSIFFSDYLCFWNLYRLKGLPKNTQNIRKTCWHKCLRIAKLL